MKRISLVDLSMAKKVPLEFRHDVSGWNNYHYTQTLFSESAFSSAVASNGRVDTTLDLYLQNESQAILRSHLKNLKKFDVHHGAVVVMNNDSGDVLAYVGSQDLLNKAGGQYDALKLKRQPGSALKPLTFALALMKGKKLSDVLPDIPSYYKTGLGQFLPRNYDQSFSGPRLMREALANSLNLPALALAQEVGVSDLHYFYKSMGLHLEKDPLYYGVGMTLGNIEITPLELIQVYTSFPRGGTRVLPRFFKNQSVRTVETPLVPEAAFLISDVLSDKVARREEFGEANPFDLPFSFSVKTGTSTDFRDNWVIGFNRDFSILVWVGNTDQSPMKRVSGITGAGPVLRDIARYLATRFKMKPIPRISKLERADICALSGNRPGIHCSHLKSELFISGTVPLTTCKWHQEIVVRDCRGPSDEKKIRVAVLPDAYQAWIKERPEWSIESQVNEYCSFEDKKFDPIVGMTNGETIIARPLSGSIYAIDPNLPRSLQKLKLEIGRFHLVKKVFWKRNGAILSSGGPTYEWPLEKGSHEFEAEVQFDNGQIVQTPKIEVKVL